MSDTPRVNHTDRVFRYVPNDNQALAAQPAAANVEEMAPGGERAPPRYRDIRSGLLTNESPRVRRTSSSWNRREGFGGDIEDLRRFNGRQGSSANRSSSNWAAFGSPPPRRKFA